MNPKEYIEFVKKTESKDFPIIHARMRAEYIIRLDHASDGLVTEAAEFKDAIKKWKFYGKELDTVNLVEELGDLMWYIGIACDALGFSLEDIMELNIAKLKKRYGIEFNEEGAIKRDLSAERYILEKKDIKVINTFNLVHLSIGGVTTSCMKYVSEIGYYTSNFQDTTCEACIKASKVNYSKDICENE